MMNRTDTKKAVILLGTGFAREFDGPSSADLFDRIKIKLQVEGDELPQLFLKKLDEYYGANNYNFETFIAALELIETIRERFCGIKS